MSSIPETDAPRLLGPAVQSHGEQAAMFGHPPGLFILFIVEMWERFSYYGMRALLVLYLIARADGHNPGRGMSVEDAADLYGWYTGFAYLMPIFGGIVADKLIGAHRSVLLGGVLISLGHISLAVSGLGGLGQSHAGMAIFVLGLGLIVIGTGHFKPNVSVMVGRLYREQDPRRDAAFTIFYMGINVGAFISALICGALGEWIGWHWGFGAAAVGMLLGLGIYIVTRPLLLAGVGAPPATGARWGSLVLFFMLAIGLACCAAGAFYFDVFASASRAWDSANGTPAGHRILFASSWLIGLCIPAAAFRLVAAQARGDRGPTAVILVFIVFNAIFWLAFEQGGTSLNLFAENMTRRYIAGHEVPASWFQSVGALLVILLAPAFAALWQALGRRGLDPTQPVKIAIALFLLGGGYLFMVAAAAGASPGHRASMFWLLATYTMHELGELTLSPTGLAFVTRVAPVRFVSLLMGLSFLSNSLANWLGGRLAGQIDHITDGRVHLFWYRWFHLGGQADFFFLFVLSSFAAGLLVLLLTPFLNWLLGPRAS